jgi:hypothetical protein
MADELQCEACNTFQRAAAPVNSPEEIFETQIQNLAFRRYPDAAGMSEREFLSHVSPLKKKLVLSKQLIEEGAYYCLIVIPESFVSIPKQFSLLTCGIESFTKSFDPVCIRELRELSEIKAPRMPYLAMDLQIESGIESNSPRNSLRRLRRAGRSGLTVVEGIALVLHFPSALVRSGIDLLGCRHKGDFPYVYRGADGQARLGFGDAEDADPQWAAASCRSRLAM